MFRKGKLHANVDILSRPVLDQPIEMSSVPAKWEAQIKKFEAEEKFKTFIF